MTLYKIAPDVIWVTCLDQVVCLKENGVQAVLNVEISKDWLNMAEGDNGLNLRELKLRSTKCDDENLRYLVQLHKAGFLQMILE